MSLARFEQIQQAVRVEGRHLALPISEYYRLDSFAGSNRAWARVAPQLGAEAIARALEQAAVAPGEIDAFFLTTGTGIATPSIDVEIANRLGMRADVKRTPIFGLGCAGGAAAIARASDYLRSFPAHAAVALSVELCSLTLQRQDLTVANMIASGLFGDGAAAVVLRGAERSAVNGPRVIATRSVLYADTRDAMGWEIVEGGFKIVLSGRVPTLVRTNLRDDVDSFLGEAELARSDIRHWIAHTGGPRVLEAVQDALELPPGVLDLSWRSLARIGNVSSASVLFVLADLLETGTVRHGDYGVMFAMGPGFCAELALLQW